jgi:hypothetical protein
MRRTPDQFSGETPHRPCREFRIFRLEIEPVNFRQQAPRRVQGAVDKRVVEDQFCSRCRSMKLEFEASYD